MKIGVATWMVVSFFALAGEARAASGDTIASFASPGDSASGLGWDGEHLWVANLQTALGQGANRVTKHDRISGAELGGFDMQGTDVFHGMAFDEVGNIYSDNFNKTVILDTDIVKIDQAGNTLAVYPAFGTIYGVALDLSQRRLFQVDNHSVEPGGNDMPSDLYVLDMDTMALISGPIELSLVAARGVAWDGGTLWVASNSSDSVYRIDVDTGATVAQFVAPGEGGVEGLTWDGQCIWISDTRGDVIYRVDHGQADLPPCTPFDPMMGAGGGGGSGAGGDAAGGGSGGVGQSLGGGGAGPTAPQHQDDSGQSADSGGCSVDVSNAPARDPWWLMLAGLITGTAAGRRRARCS